MPLRFMLGNIKFSLPFNAHKIRERAIFGTEIIL